MRQRLPRRKRLAIITVAAASVFVVGIAIFVYLALRRREQYRPGETVEGLTSDLSRDLPPDHPRVTFTDVTEQAGIHFRHFDGRRSSQLPEDMGSGAAWGDYDGDGWPDLYVVNMVGPLTMTPGQVAASPARSALYHNNRDGTFTDVAEQAGVAFRGWGMGAAWGDYDNDGHLDLIVTAYGRNVLYRSRGDGTFEDVSGKAGVKGPKGFWAGATWVDYDRDGYLDLYITGYVQYDTAIAKGTSRQYAVEVPASLNPSAFKPERNLLYHNNRDGTFTEVAAKAGVLGDKGRSLSATAADFDEDGWPDIYVANDVSDNVFYRNRGDGTFSDISQGAHVADYRGAMGLAVGDWNGDGDLDIFVAHWLAQENALYESQLRDHFVSLAAAPPGRALQFMDEADRWGVGQIALDFVGFGTSFLDYDDDGRPDLIVANGSTLQQAGKPELLVPMRDQLFWNGGPDRGFFDVSAVAGPHFAQAHVGRGLATADYDNDGNVDVFIVNNGDRPVLLHNNGQSHNHWLELRPEGRKSNRQGIGARISLLVGGKVQVQEIGSQSSYLSQNNTVAHFGLGQARKADTLEVRWPSGLRQLFHDVPADHILLLVEGQGLVDAPIAPGKAAVATGPAPSVSGAGAGGTTPTRGSPTPAAAGGSRTGAPMAASNVAAERARVRRFWALMRQAFADRIAGRGDAAVVGYRAALDLNPNHEDALYYLGSVLLERRDFSGAEQAWRRLVDMIVNFQKDMMRKG